jgi:hypothetical protein
MAWLALPALAAWQQQLHCILGWAALEVDFGSKHAPMGIPAAHAKLVSVQAELQGIVPIVVSPLSAGANKVCSCSKPKEFPRARSVCAWQCT